MKKEPCTCAICNKPFMRKTNEKTCADTQCRITFRRLQNREYNRKFRETHPKVKVQKPTLPEQPTGVSKGGLQNVVTRNPQPVTILNKRTTKPEAVAVEHMKFLANKPQNDAHLLKVKHVKSPDVSKMPFRLHDPRMKTTVFFTSLERKNRYIEHMAAHPNSEPLKKGGRFSNS